MILVPGCEDLYVLLVNLYMLLFALCVLLEKPA